VRVRVVVPAVSGLKLNWLAVLVAPIAMVPGLPATVPTAGLESANDMEIGAAWGPRVPVPANVRDAELRIARFAVTVVFALVVVVLIVEEPRYRPDGSSVNVKVPLV
jgi:hypothetical protein